MRALTAAGVVLAAGLVLTATLGLSPALAAEQCLTEDYRLQYHFSPRKNWINDPNGLIYFDNEWHMFYQYSQTASKPDGSISWGHAVSTDLIHWDELDVAIAADDKEQIFSGSAVIDSENTAGFGKDAMVAVYTSASKTDGIQAQSIAFSTDKGRTFTKYDKNPVLNENKKDFRDPSVQWYEPGKYWIMVVSLVKGPNRIRFYKSTDLKSWEQMSEFGPAGAFGPDTGKDTDLQYECPDLFPLPVEGDPNKGSKWILIVNINPGAPQGGSAAQYFIGDFDGVTFKADDDKTRWVDVGKDNYAGITWKRAPDGNVYFIGWMSNWDYSEKTPTTVWRNGMTLPRKLSLKLVGNDLTLTQMPVEAVYSLKKASLRMMPSAGETITLVNETLDASSVARVRRSPREFQMKELKGTAYHLSVTLANPTGAKRQGVKVRVGGNQYTSIVFDNEEKTLKIDRTSSGDVSFDPTNFPGKHGGPVVLRDGKLKLDVFVDWSSVEVFANDGELAITETIFPEASSDGVQLFVEEGRGEFERLKLSELKSYREC